MCAIYETEPSVGTSQGLTNISDHVDCKPSIVCTERAHNIVVFKHLRWCEWLITVEGGV